MEHSSLILRANWVLPISHDPISDGEVVIENGQIVEVRPRSEAKGSDVVEFGDAIVMPGLVNGHCHLEYTGLRGYDDHTPFFAWVRALVTLKQQMPSDFWLPSAMLGVAECLASGITFISDNTDSGVSVEALARAGLRGRVYQEVFGISPEPSDAEILHELNTKLATYRKQLSQFSAQERISLGVSPHAVYTVRDSLMRETLRYAREENLPISIHAAESAEEVALTRSGSGSFAEMLHQRRIPYLHPRVSPVEYLYKIGALGEATQLVHCIRVDPREIEWIAQSRAHVAHCPRSNARLLTGVAPISTMIRQKIPIVVGTDSAVSAGTLDMWEELRFGALIQRATSYTPIPNWKEWVAIATLKGAQVFGVGGQIGSLEPGKRADLIVVRTHRAGFTSTPDPYAGLVLVAHSSDVALTMVEGQTLYQDGKWLTLDVNHIQATIQQMLAQAQGV